MLGHRPHDGVAELIDLRHVVAIARRKTAAEIDHAQVHAGLGQVGEQHRHAADRRLVGARRGLLAADVKRQAIRVEPELAGAQHQLARALDRGAELARQRPVRALVLHQDAAIDPRPRRVRAPASPVPRRNRRRTSSPRLVRAADRRHLLDRVAEADRLRPRAGVQARLDLLDPGGVERLPSEPDAPAPAAPDWPSRRNRSAPAAGRDAARGNSPPRGRRPAPGTALPAGAQPGNGRSSGSSHRASLEKTPA